jgi:hypothetical protein
MVAASSDIIVEQFELRTTGGASTLHPVGATEQVIGDLSRDRSAGIANHNHLAGHDLFAVDETGIVSRSFSTPATRLDLNLRAPVGEFHEPRRTREHHALERGQQSEGIHIDAEFVDHTGQLFALDRIIELSLIAYHCINPPERAHPLTNKLKQIRSGLYHLCISGNSETA